jgi:PilZ domain
MLTALGCQRVSVITYIVDEIKASAGSPAQRGPADRRTQPRYRFTALADVVDKVSGKNVEAKVVDISERGCHAETNKPFPLGTETKILIRKGADSFATHARVVYSSGSGMGLAFSDISLDQLPTLESWLGSSRERDWLTRNRRRTQRVLMRIQVRVSCEGTPASRFAEDTYTLAINAHGASIPLSRPISKGQRLEILNVVTGDKAECVVAHLGQRHGDHIEVGVEFILANPRFWRVAFPPTDWTPEMSGTER